MDMEIDISMAKQSKVGVPTEREDTWQGRTQIEKIGQ